MECFVRWQWMKLLSHFYIFPWKSKNKHAQKVTLRKGNSFDNKHVFSSRPQSQYFFSVSTPRGESLSWKSFHHKHHLSQAGCHLLWDMILLPDAYRNLDCLQKEVHLFISHLFAILIGNLQRLGQNCRYIVTAGLHPHSAEQGLSNSGSTEP